MKTVMLAAAMMACWTAAATVAVPRRTTETGPTIKVARTIPLHEPDGYAGDVAWVDDHTIVVALLTGVWKVNVDTGAKEIVIRRGELPDGSPYPLLVGTDGSSTVVVGAEVANYLGFTRTGQRIFAYGKSAFVARDVVLSGGKVWYLGWMGRGGADTDARRRGALWVTPLKPTSSEYDEALSPVHEILSDEALSQWRLSAHPYAGSIVAEPDGTIDVATSVEPGVYRYDRDGHLMEVLCPQTALLLSSTRIGREYPEDIDRRYREYVNQREMLDGLIVTPWGLALLVRKVENGQVKWELWIVDEKGVTARRPLLVTRRGPFGHMRCEARGARMACVLSIPSAEDASVVGPSQKNPTLLLYDLR